ncbi:hypothetical protein H8S77_27940 [Parabacteroides sp. BX2]|jgi:hypothetical protein|uniref:Bvu-2165-like IHF-HU-like DNA-binding domain-containing protein n=2 Tax=Parabacteroides TaxID=375288 RepID=A0ABR7EA80_9BACT|nr:DNA-binding domain-containing protein [Parabacteroides segnis]MBC5646682.1 hypothetical protein [Parabacteroides segnis]
MKTILRAYAYRNALKKPVGPFYYLRALSLGRLGIGDIIARISRLPFAITQQEYAFLVNLFLDECIAAATEGYHIATPQMRWSPTIRGTIVPSDFRRTFAPGRLPVSFRLTPGPAARKASSEISVHICGEAVLKGRGAKDSNPEGGTPKGGP